MEPNLSANVINREPAAATGTTAVDSLQLGFVACIVGSATRMSSQRGGSHAHLSNRSISIRGSPPLFRTKRPLALQRTLDADALAAIGQILRQASPNLVGPEFTAPPARNIDSDITPPIKLSL